ncbi:MAG: hypothetical protein IPG29_17175 [Sphingobacteriales bacterium]|nr:hypothetical protein [Sphingobacteriales bacterium]
MQQKMQKGRPHIERSEYQQYVDINKKKHRKNKKTCINWQQIVEHPYGTIKRQWVTPTSSPSGALRRAAADVGLIMTAYNLRRLFNILPRELFKTWLKPCFCLFFVFL